MASKSDSLNRKITENFFEFSQLSDYSFMNSLNPDPQSTKDGKDHKPRSVFSAIMLVTPTDDSRTSMFHTATNFKRTGTKLRSYKRPKFLPFSQVIFLLQYYPMSSVGWATGYALSIYGTEYTNNVLWDWQWLWRWQSILYLKVYSMGKEWRCN